MPTIFDALPGLAVPVEAISRSLAEMWTSTAASGRAAPAADDAKATQVNFVLHLGFDTTPEDAAAQFDTMVQFSRRCPSRIVVLCPLRDDAGITEMRAKIFGECHLGKSPSDKRCVEFVLLSYPRSARGFLENQVSICLSTDLPLYYWAHRFSVSARLADYRFLLGRAKRVLIDSAIAPADAFTFPWPNPAALRDLVYCRLLPVRQTIGQFLAGYAPSAIVEGLRQVQVGHAPTLTAEARVTLAWLKRRIAACGASAEGVEFSLAVEESDGLRVRFGFDGERKRFAWTGNLSSRQALFEADFGTGPSTLPAAVSLLNPEQALSEAVFF